MPQQLKYVAQLAMDEYFQNYKGENDFWDLSDFIQTCGNTISKLYTTFYQQEYSMLRQEKKDEVISFDAGWLLEQEAEVKQNGVGLCALLDNPVMTFPWDKSSIGIQNVFITEPATLDELERTSLAALWQLKYMPKTNRIFFYSDVAKTDCVTISKIGFVNKGSCNIKKVRILYVPVMNDGDAPVPDGIISDAITNTILEMKKIAEGNVVDMTENQNSNKTLQTEIDHTLLGK